MDDRLQTVRQRFIKYARLLMSLLFLVACVASMALWVRSYRVKDMLWMRYSGDKFLRASSHEGVLLFSIRTFGNQINSVLLLHDHAGRSLGYKDDFGRTRSPWRLQILRWRSGHTEVHVPLWLLPLIAATLSALIAVKRRFSIRTLLVAFLLLSIILATAASSRYDAPKSQAHF